MGEVYLAQHPRLPRRDALKVLSDVGLPESEYRNGSTGSRHRATLWHPAHRRGARPRRRRRPAVDLDGLRRAGPTRARCSPSAIRTGCRRTRWCGSVTAVADALDYAHQRGLLHRDVKPANILMANPGADDRADHVGRLRDRPPDRRTERAHRDEHDGGHGLRTPHPSSSRAKRSTDAPTSTRLRRRRSSC
mgnify:CR=1 FL=1